MKQAFQTPPPELKKKGWVAPNLVVYGDMTTITQQCNPPACKPKEFGAGDDFSNNISTM